MWSLLKILIPFMSEIVEDKKRSHLEDVIYNPMKLVRSVISVLVTLLALFSTTGLIKVSAKYLELEDRIILIMKDCSNKPPIVDKKI